MNPIQIIATLRKFANYIAGLFPFLAVFADKIASRIKTLAEHPWIHPITKRASKSAFLSAIWKFFERFYWRDYAKDRMEFGASPPETVNVLRTIIQLCVVLSVVIPLSQFQPAPVEIETFSGYKHTVSMWFILLWMLSLPCAWAALLVGTAVCNRIAFSLTALGALYFLSTCVIQFPRSYFNGFLTFAVLFSLIHCERTLSRDGKTSSVLSWLNALIVGIAAGCQFTILTPLRPWLATIFTLPGPVLSLGFGSALGAVAGITCLNLARKPSSKLLSARVLTADIPMAPAIWSVASFLLLLLVAGASRGGLPQLGGLLISSIDMSNAYLWPILYFIGVGIIHKLLGSSKIIATSVRGMIHQKLVIPLMLVLLVTSTIVALSEHICGYLAQQTGETWSFIFNAFLPVYKFGKWLIWHDPLLSMAAHWMIWVLTLDIVVTSTLAVQKRLTADGLTRLFFTTCLAALLVWEYLFQMASFARGPIHSVIMIWLFAVWLLWLMHTVGWSLSLQSSPAWPSRGRFAVYGGVVTLIILQVNARATSHDYRIVNELFLTMFRGVIDVGLPYYLLIWANKRTQVKPPVGLLLGTFAAGSLTSMLFNALDKLAGSGWSLTAFSTVVKAQLERLQALGTVNVDLSVPGYWLFMKAAIFVSLLILMNKLNEKKSVAATNESSTVIGSLEDKPANTQNAHRQLMTFLMVAFASGVVSFSYTLVDLPLPTELRVMFAPLQQEVLFNCNILHTYLAYWIPALLLALVTLKTNRRFDLMCASIIGLTINGAILFSYEHYEVWLRATGLLYPVLIVLTGILLALLTQLLATIETSRSSAQSDTAPPPQTPDALLSYRSSRNLCLAAAVAFALISLLPSGPKSITEQSVPTLQHSVALERNWKFQSLIPATGRLPEFSVFTRPSTDGPTTIQISQLSSDPAGAKHHLQMYIDMLHLNVIKQESWDRYYPGAYACSFLFVDKASLTTAGLSVFVPRPNGRTEAFTLTCPPSNFEQAVWEIALLVQRLHGN